MKHNVCVEPRGHGNNKEANGQRVGSNTWLEGAIDVLAMTELDNIYDEFVVFDSVHDSILTLADSIAVMTRKFLASHRTGFAAELLNPLYDALAIFFPRDGLDLLHGRGLNQNPISSHYVSSPLRHLQT